MKKIFLPILIFSFSEALAQPSIDVLHYTFRIQLSDNNDTVYGEAAIKFVRSAGAKTIEFDLAGQSSKGKGMKVQSVRHLEGWPGEIVIRESRFTQANDKVSITVDEKSFKKDTGFYIINYKGKYAVKQGSYESLKPMCDAITERSIGATVETIG